MTWKPIETAPKDGSQILLHDKWESPKFVVVGFWGPQTEADPPVDGDDGSAQWRTSWDHAALTDMFDPTHWVEIPETPK